MVKRTAAEDHERKKFRAKATQRSLNSKANMYQAMGRYQAAISGMMGVFGTVVLVLGGWMISSRGQIAAMTWLRTRSTSRCFTANHEHSEHYRDISRRALLVLSDSQNSKLSQTFRNAPGAHDIHITAGDIIYQDVHLLTTMLKKLSTA